MKTSVPPIHPGSSDMGWIVSQLLECRSWNKVWSSNKMSEQPGTICWWDRSSAESLEMWWLPLPQSSLGECYGNPFLELKFTSVQRPQRSTVHPVLRALIGAETCVSLSSAAHPLLILKLGALKYLFLGHMCILLSCCPKSIWMLLQLKWQSWNIWKRWNQNANWIYLCL